MKEMDISMEEKRNVNKEGFVFNRFYADCMFMNNPIEQEDMI